MTDMNSDDRSSDPEYTQLGEDGNPFSNTSAGQKDAGQDGAAIDQVPADPATGYDDDTDQNAPLPDWGPTDGTHGVDGADPSE